MENIRRWLYGLAGAVLVGLSEFLTSGATITWRTLGAAVLGAVTGYMGTKKKPEGE